MTSIDEYELFLGYVGELVNRRQTITTTYISVNGAGIGAIAFLFKDGQLLGPVQQASVLLLLISGIFISTLWRRLIRQYSTLLSWWYQTLREIEANMPDSNKLLTREYQDLYDQGKGKAMLGMTRYEIALTWVFTSMYAVFSLIILINLGSLLL